MGCRTIPDFDRLVVRAGHNRLSVGREGHRVDVIAVRISFITFELQGSSCETSGAGRLSKKSEEENVGVGICTIPDFGCAYFY